MEAGVFTETKGKPAVSVPCFSRFPLGGCFQGFRGFQGRGSFLKGASAMNNVLMGCVSFYIHD